MTTNATVVGLDFGTTNSVAAIASGAGDSRLVALDGPDGRDPVFRSALCFWEEAGRPSGLADAAGPWGIAEYLASPQDSRFLQSFKSVAASASFDHATIFDRRLRFEEIGRRFLARFVAAAGDRLPARADRLVVGRPVAFAGSRPDEALARTRYDAMFGTRGASVHYVYEPIGAAYSFAARHDGAATILVADFGGGTSDFSVVRLNPAGAARRCEPLGHAGVGIAGDRFDYRIIDRLVLPLLGKGGQYRSFDKLLEIPRGYFADFADWSKLALMRNRRTLAELDKLRRAAIDPDAIARMIAIVEAEQGYRLYDAVGRLKRALSRQDEAMFRFEGAGVLVEAPVTRAAFEDWIAADLVRMDEAVDRALAAAGVAATGIDRVFLTGGTSLTPAVRALFVRRFGEDAIATGAELTSIAHGLALIGQEEDIAAWSIG